MRHRILAALFLLIFIGTFSLAAQSVFTDRKGVAARGHDLVAYFTESMPVEGDPAISTVYKGVTYHFSSKANQTLFKADPERYLPAFGGYCAYAVSKGSHASTQPHLWIIHNDQLYLNFSAGTFRKFSADLDGYIARASANWPAVKARLDKK